MRGFMAKLRRDVRALSPIFAVLLLIAIAVIAGIIIYMYTSGYLATMMGGGGAGQEKVAILSIDTSTAGTIKVNAKSVGGGDVIITEAIVKDAAGKVLATVDITDVTLASAGTMNTVNVSYAFTSGEYYTVTLVSKLGNVFVSSAFKA